MPCVTNVRGSSVGVSEAAKKSVPIRRPTAEKERQNLKIQNSLIGAATCDRWSASRQLAVQDASAQPATARNHGDATNSIPIWSSLCSGTVFPNFRGAVARRSPRVSKETEQRRTMAELHRLWRLETEFGTERPQLTKRKHNRRLLYIWRFRDVRCLPAMGAEVRLDYATAPSGHPLLGALRRTTIGWKQVDKRPWRHHLTTLLLLRAGYAYLPYMLAGERDRADKEVITCRFGGRRGRSG